MRRSKSTESIIAIIGGLIVFYLIYKVELLLMISLVLIVIGLFSGFLSDKIDWLWRSTGKLIGYVNSRVLLILVFFFLLTPLAFLWRIFRRNRTLKETASNYKAREFIVSEKDFHNPF